jgi:hypothetical protein
MIVFDSEKERKDLKPFWVSKDRDLRFHDLRSSFGSKTILSPPSQKPPSSKALLGPMQR